MTANSASISASSVGVPSTTPRQHRPRSDRRTPRARSTGPPTSRHAPPPPAWDNDLPVSASQQGTFAADGTFVLDRPASTRSRERGPRRNNRQQHRSQSRLSQCHRKPIPMPTGYFTADGQFMAGSPEESGVFSDSAAVPTVPRSRTEKPKSMSSLIPSGRSVSGKQQRGGSGTSSGSTPAKEAAYAGPTFHASPDPSALPIPRFFSAMKSGLSKSDGEDSVSEAPSSRISPSDLQSPPETPTPKLSHIRSAQYEESPLDIFFTAQKKDRGSSAELPASQPGSSRGSPTPATPAPDRATQKRIQPNSSKRDFLTQLIGSVHTPTGAKASTQSTPSGSYPAHARPMLDDQPSPFITHPIDHSARPSVPNQNSSFPPPGRDNPPGPPSGPHASFPQSEPAAYRPFHYPTNTGQPYHYGNANLSHLFKAAATPNRISRAHTDGFHPHSHARRGPRPVGDLRHIEEGMRQLSTAGR